MVDQILQGKTTKNGFNKQAWSQMRTEFNKKTGCDYNQNQLRNRKGVLKSQYQSVKGLLEQPGFYWDENQQMVTAEDAVWNEYLKVHPDADKFRIQPFPVYEQLCIITGDPSTNGRYAKSSQHWSLGDNTPDYTQHSVQEQADTNELPGNLPLVGQDKDSAHLDRDPDNTGNRSKRRSTAQSSSSHTRRKESVASDLAEAVFEFADALRFKTLATTPFIDPYAISKCIKELEAIKGVTDQEVFGAIDVFRDPLLREAFMTMQPQRRLRWLRTQIKLEPQDS
ncbi:hypothetical protein HHK36_020456 [Tetracentron sinense]|uniref:Myb/SANT-like domain-containing protein n=1 Tax=Tetracentron sinense TaxID=13715 RepID=A0A835DBM8_TETSI|nr:hypothetical protein HHK36_020456 [Tetracentron sinense]